MRALPRRGRGIRPRPLLPGSSPQRSVSSHPLLLGVRLHALATGFRRLPRLIVACRKLIAADSSASCKSPRWAVASKGSGHGNAGRSLEGMRKDEVNMAREYEE